MLVQLPRLVVGCLEDGRSSHRRLGGGDQGKVLARDAEKNLPSSQNWVSHRTADASRQGCAAHILIVAVLMKSRWWLEAGIGPRLLRLDYEARLMGRAVSYSLLVTDTPQVGPIAR